MALLWFHACFAGLKLMLSRMHQLLNPNLQTIVLVIECVNSLKHLEYARLQDGGAMNGKCCGRLICLYRSLASLGRRFEDCAGEGAGPLAGPVSA